MDKEIRLVTENWAAELRDMSISGKLRFPAANYSTIRQTIARLRIESGALRSKWNIDTAEKSKGYITVKRLS